MTLLAPRPSHAATWFVLGHAPLLSAAELWSVLPTAVLTYAAPFVFLEDAAPAEALMSKLGGTVKIGRTVAHALPRVALIEQLTEQLAKKPGKIIFGLSVYGDAPQAATIAEHIGLSIKTALVKRGRTARFVFNNDAVLSSAAVAGGKLLERGSEILLTVHNNEYFAAFTQAVQPFADWSERDYGRPGRDELSGMLPPKLARIMLNLAQMPPSSTVCDPFCGSGTIITEALALGCRQVIGADLSDTAVADTKKNVAWLVEKNPAYAPRVQIFQADVADLSKKISGRSLTAIVSEPYMGPPLRGHEPSNAISKTVRELAALYLIAFQSFARVLTNGGAVVFTIPQFSVRHKTYRVADYILPKIKKLGFTPTNLLPSSIHREPFILYKRPAQRVGREVWRFSFNAPGA